MGILSPFSIHASGSEQNLLEDLIIESLHHRGSEFFYIPRTLLGKDVILGEDRLSEFKNAYPIEAYFEDVSGYEGGGFMIQKFGLMIDQSATLVIAKRRWEQLVGRFGKTILPNRPSEGDLLFFPLTKTLFDIKFVEHQNPFYQLGKLYVYKLQIETFVYGSETINTGIEDIDLFESLKSNSMEDPIGSSPEEPLTSPDDPNNYGSNNEFKDAASEIVFDVNNPFGDIVN